VASYLHRDGRIPLGFTVINGERFYGASVPEAVIAFVVAMGGLAALAAPRRARPVAAGATVFAILGVAYGLSVTAGTGRVIDIACHCALMTVLLATGIVLWRWESRPGAGPPRHEADA
jgi:hydrogenase/urease accessory protein HupE